MMQGPLVSVLITVYNDELNIGKAIDSIINQTYQRFELVIVNDGSTDTTLTILMQYQRIDDRIKIISQDNQGTAVAANNGLQHCTGKYIARLDSDDISYPGRLAEEVKFMEANPHIGLVGGGCHIADSEGRIIGTRNIYTTSAYKTLLNRCIYQQSDVMFRKDVLSRLPGTSVYRNKFKGAEDYDLWLRISEVTEVAKINAVFGIWKLNGGGYTLSRKQEQLEAIKELKRMAIARRKGSADWYDSFQPKVIEKAHRTQLKDYEYDLTAAQVLLKEARSAEVRQQLKKYQSKSESWKAVRKWYYLSFLPKPVLKSIFDFREFILNRSFIELR
jgi:glycosyltransferase involved in cell wall biosynthesis